MGETLVEAVAPLIGWANEHLREIEAARAVYDRKLETEAEQ
jgi:DNA-binding HxlR family transcriptional regulator